MKCTTTLLTAIQFGLQWCRHLTNWATWMVRGALYRSTIMTVGRSASLQQNCSKGVYRCCRALTDNHAIKAYWVSRGVAPRILTSALDGGEWSASRPGRFTPRESVSVTHWRGGWVGLRAGLDTVVKKKIPSPCWNSNSRPSSPQSSTVPLS
jgi:hypothetical protein